MPALVRTVVVAPHLEADLQRLLEALEALGQRRERHAEAEVLALVPGGTDAELGPAAREHVEGGDDLGQQPGVAVGDAGDEQPAAACRSVLRGHEAEGRVALEHRVGRGGAAGSIWNQWSMTVKVVAPPSSAMRAVSAKAEARDAGAPGSVKSTKWMPRCMEGLLRLDPVVRSGRCPRVGPAPVRM